MDDLKITGKVTRILEEKSGQGRNGPWRKQEFILETEGQYPKEVCIVQWGDNIDTFGVQEGERITAHIDVQSREYEGRWYTDVKAWRVERDQPQQAGNASAPDPFEGPIPEEPWEPSASDDDLPF